MALPTQTTHLHPWYPSTCPCLPQTHTDNNASELKSLIDQHLAWQDNALRPGTQGTLLVDWDGSRERLLSHRCGDVASLREDDDGVSGVVEYEEEERGVREVLKERKTVQERQERKERKGEDEVLMKFLIRRKPVPVRQSVSMGQGGEEREKDVGVGVGVGVGADKAVPEVGKGLPEVPAEERMDRLPIFYRYEEVLGEGEEVKRKERGSVRRLAEGLKEESLEVWGMLKYEGRELMAVLKYEGKELLEDFREEGRWLSVVLRREWKDGRVVVGKGIRTMMCYV